jgi:serine/threonine protein kinase
MDEIVTFAKQLGSGGFGKIFLLTNNSSDTKILLPEVIVKTKNNTRCIKISDINSGYKEFKFLSKLNNNNIVKVYDYNENLFHDKFYFTMDRYDYDLKQVKKNNIKIDYKKLISNIINGLSYIHNLGLVHRDIKPENLLYSEDKYVICDFNTSNIFYYKSGNTEYLTKFETYESYDDKILGTIAFSSYFVSIGCLAYIRDDIESFYITLLYLTDKVNTIFGDIFTKKEIFIHRFFKRSLNNGIINYLRKLAYFEIPNYENIIISLNATFVEKSINSIPE